MSAMNKLRMYYQKVKIALAEMLISGDKYYIQDLPLEVYHRASFPSYRDEVRRYNQRRDKVSRDATRWFGLELILRQVKEIGSGDYAELGTYKGKTARQIFLSKRPDACLYCFDTFEGFNATDVDEEDPGNNVVISPGAFGNTSIQEVEKYIMDAKASDQLYLRKGHFPDSFSGLEGITWAFVHLDCDLATPTKAGLERFWVNLLPGGVIVVHDYNGYYSAGIKPVVDQFAKKNNIIPIPLPDNGGSVVLAKPIRV